MGVQEMLQQHGAYAATLPPGMQLPMGMYPIPGQAPQTPGMHALGGPPPMEGHALGTPGMDAQQMGAPGVEAQQMGAPGMDAQQMGAPHMHGHPGDVQPGEVHTQGDVQGDVVPPPEHAPALAQTEAA
jgi:hypothetical protein